MQNDAALADIARRLAAALRLRARTRLPDDQKTVLAIQTELCAAVNAEAEVIEEGASS